MESVLDYLQKNENKNAYVIRNILNSMQGFSYELERDSLGNIVALLAKWYEENIITLRGDYDICKKWFLANRDNYDFYDLEESLVHKLSDLDHGYEMTEYFILERPKIRCDLSENQFDYLIKSVDLIEWTKVSNLFLDKFSKNIPEFQENNAECFVLYENNYENPVCVQYIEKVHNGFSVLSNLYTIPTKRGQGFAKAILSHVVSKFNEAKLIMFVETKHNALHFYQSIGFSATDKLINLDRF